MCILFVLYLKMVKALSQYCHWSACTEHHIATELRWSHRNFEITDIHNFPPLPNLNCGNPLMGEIRWFKLHKVDLQFDDENQNHHSLSDLFSTVLHKRFANVCRWQWIGRKPSQTMLQLRRLEQTTTPLSSFWKHLFRRDIGACFNFSCEYWRLDIDWWSPVTIRRPYCQQHNDFGFWSSRD